MLLQRSPHLPGKACIVTPKLLGFTLNRQTFAPAIENGLAPAPYVQLFPSMKFPGSCVKVRRDRRKEQYPVVALVTVQGVIRYRPYNLERNEAGPFRPCSHSTPEDFSRLCPKKHTIGNWHCCKLVSLSWDCNCPADRASEVVIWLPRLPVR
jgi:hypothetical protein